MGGLVKHSSICQRVRLLWNSVAVATCATVTFDQCLRDESVGVDGQNEISLYIALGGEARRE
jgi:hypothetical protein